MATRRSANQTNIKIISKTIYGLNLLFIGCCLYLSSCGKNKTGSSSFKIIPPISGNENFLEKVESTAFFCDEAECPSYTVAIAVNNSGNANPNWCTGTVLKNGQILTSRSCFSEYFFESPSSCNENVLIKNLSGNIWGCSKILSSSAWPTDSIKDPASRILDYVLIEVPLASAKTYPSVETNFENLKDNASISVWYVNHLYGDGLEVALQNKKCIYKDKNLISPWEEKSTHLMLSLCELPSSAKGSTLYQSGKQITGLIHSLSKPIDLNQWSNRVLPDTKLQHYALANTLECTDLNTPPVDTSLCEQKNFIDSKLATLRTDMFTQFNDLDKIEAQVKDYARYEKDKYIRWSASLRYVNEDLLYEVDFIPECFMNNKSWLEEFRGGLFNMFYDKSGSVFKEWPLLKVYSGINSQFEMKTDLFNLDTMLYETFFGPRNLKKHNKSDVKVVKGPGQQLVTELKDITFCQ